MSHRGAHLIAFNRYLCAGRSGCSKSVIFTTRQVCSPGNSAPSGLAARLFRSSHLVESFGTAGARWLIGNGMGLQTMPNILDIQGAVRFCRIATHGLYIPLRNLISVDFPCRLVVTHSLLSIHSFGSFCAAPPDFQQVMSSR
jgi:hypothetical protein